MPLSPLTVFQLLAFLVAAQVPAVAADPLFSSDEPLEIRISAPLRTLMRERPEEDELDGVLSWTESDGRQIEVRVALRTRGNYRRQWRVCPFAPLRLNVRRSEVEDTVFHNQDKIKLVTHCRDRSSRHEQVLFREYLSYRMFNELTDFSYRVRMLHITYEDTETDRKDRVTWGFLIEHSDRFTERTGVSLLSVPRTYVDLLDPEFTSLTSVFQYFIGNTDYSPIAGAADTDCCHNTHLYGGGDDAPIMPVAYDFDFAGMVNAPYAAPNPKLGLRTVRQRLFRGRCEHNAHIPATLEKFRARRDAFYALVAEDPRLNGSSRRSMTNFLDSFYEVIDDPRQVERRLVESCVG